MAEDREISSLVQERETKQNFLLAGTIFFVRLRKVERLRPRQEEIIKNVFQAERKQLQMKVLRFKRGQ